VPYLIIAVLLSLLVGLACGTIAGTLISRFNIPAILATLGTQQLFTGIAIGITNGRPQSRLPLLYSKIGNLELFNFVPLPFIIFSAVAFGIGLILSRTRFGTHMYMMGTNAHASRYAGLIMMARANSAKADYGAPYTLQCVFIAVLGGIDPNGGFETITGVTMAILILQFLSSGLNMFNKLLSWRAERRAVHKSMA